MKSKIVLIAFIAQALLLSSCDNSDSIKGDNKLGGNVTPMSEVGNTFSVSGLAEASNVSAKVTALEGGVSDVTISMTLNDPFAIEFAKSIPDLVWNGNKISVSRKYRITDKGVQSVHEEGNLTLVEYEGEVGDKYSLKMNGKNVNRLVTHKSITDDYSWAFFDIKVLKVEETGRGLIGVSKLEYFLNHKFGLVGLRVFFEDGSTREVTIFSLKDNK